MTSFMSREELEKVGFKSIGENVLISRNATIYGAGNISIGSNVRIDDFVDVWENKFKWFRECDKLKCEDCVNCESWRYCKGGSLHTWDFDLNKPKICLNNILKEMD